MKKLQKLKCPAPLFLAALVPFYELLLHFWVTEHLMIGRVLAVAAFALAWGFFLGLLVSLISKPRYQKRAAVILGLGLAVVYLLEYFLNDAYKKFMTFQTVFAGADGIAEDYFDLVMGLLAQNAWRIGLVLLPVLIYGLFAKPMKTRWSLRGILAAVAITASLLGVGVVQVFEVDAARLTTAYNFDSAVRSFGLNTALTLDAVRSHDDQQPTFIPAATEPAATEAATEPEATEVTEAPTEPPIVYEDNAMDLDFAALAESESNDAVAAIHSYVASLTPTKQNEFTGLFEGKNLIFITAEAFAAEVVDPELTPTLYRLLNNGMHFTDYYQPSWGSSTTSGEFSNVIGIVPTTGAECMQESLQQNLFLTIGNRLQEEGYYSVAYHNHTRTYYDRYLTHPALGYDSFVALGSGMEEGVKKLWPESDEEMMKFTVSQYIDRQPFSVYYMTVSGHALYSKSGNNMARRNFDAVDHLPYSDTVKCYLACNMELEYGMAHLVSQLEEKGIADDTVIVIATDHYPYGLERSDAWGTDKDYLSELYGQEVTDCFIREHSALIIWSGCLEDREPIQVDTPVYSLDILPTLCNLFGVEFDSRLLVGRDVFSDAQPLIFWPDHSWKTEKGSFDAVTGIFTPAEGVTVEEGYVEQIASLVTNKITYSSAVNKNDYFNYVVDALN